MKKFLSTICALMLMTSFTSCGDTQESSSELSGSVSELTTEEDTNESETTAPEETTTKATVIETTTEKITEPAIEETSESIISETESTEDENNIDINLIDDVSVEKNEETVTIILPSDFINDLDSTITNAQNDSRIISCTLNEDSSLTYIMTQDGHSDFLNELSASCDESLNNMLSSGSYPNIVNIEHNSDFTDITVIVTDEENFSKSFDNFAVLGAMMMSANYQIFDGKEQVNYTVHYIDSYGNEFKITNFPE